MKYEFKENISIEQFDEFAYNHDIGTFFQHSNWSKVKSEWTPFYTGVYKDNKLVATALVLKRKIVLNYSLMYAPRGPILDMEDNDLLEFYLNELKKLAKSNNAISLTIDPYIIRGQYDMNGAMKNKIEVDYDDHLLETFESKNFKHTGFTLDLRDSFQPRFTPFLNLENSDYEKSRAYKQGVRAINESVKIRHGDSVDIDAFYEVIHKTEEHKNISLRSSEYFKRLKDAYGEDCLLSFAYLDLNEEASNLEHKLNDLLKRLQNPTIKEGRRREYESQVKNIEKDIEFVDLKKQEYSEVNIAVLLTLKNKTKAEFLYAGMDRDFQKYLGSNATYVDAIKWASNSGCSILSFGGNSGHFDEGIDRFKATFMPTINEYLGEFEYIAKPLVSKLFNMALEIRRR